MTKIKSILAFAAVLLCGGAWAATPVAVWENLNISDADLTQNGMTLNLNLGEGEGKNHVVGTAVEIGDKPITVTLGTNGFTDYIGTVIVKYSGISSNPSAATSLVTFDGNNGDDYTGLWVDTNGAIKGIWKHEKWSTTASNGNIKADGQSHYLTFGVEMTGSNVKRRGTHGYIDGGIVYNKDNLVGSNTKILEFNIGGYSIGTDLPVYSGLVIEKIAVFHDILTPAEAACFIFESDATHVATVNGDAITWGAAGEPTDWANAKVFVKGTGHATLNLTTAPAAICAYGEAYVDLVFDCTASNLPADNSLKNIIVGGGDNVRTIFNGSGAHGATIDFGNNNVDVSVFSHVVFSGGTHTWSSRSNNSLLKFGVNATQDNPTIRATGNATVTMNVKDPCGWSAGDSNTSGIIRVDDGSVLNFNYLAGTMYWNQQFYIEPGATFNFKDTNSDYKFRLGGGANKSRCQIYVPDSDTSSTKVAKFVQTGTYGFQVDGSTVGMGIYVGRNSKLEISAEVKNSKQITKYGDGQLVFTKSCNTTMSVSEGFIGKSGNGQFATLTISNGASVVLPEGTAEGDAYTLCTGTLTTTSATKENVGIYVGDTPIVANLTYNDTDKTVSYSKVRDIGNVYPTTNFQTFVLEDKTSTTMAAGDTVVIANNYATMNQWPYDITSLVGHDIVITRGQCNLSGTTSIGQTITANGNFTVWFYQSELADKMTIGGTAKAHVGYGGHDITLPNTVIKAAEFSVDNDKTAHVKGNVVITSTTVAISTNGRIKLHDGSTLKVSADLDAGTEAKIVGPYDSSSITKIDNGDGTKTYYPSLAAALSAARSVATSENPKTVTLLATSAENVSIPANVIVAQTQASQKLTGTITGTGTIKLTQSATSNTADLLSWINQADAMNDFAGTIHLNAGRFELKADDVAHLAKAKFKVTDGAQAFLGGGTWNNAFTISGNGYGGETGDIGCAAIRIHDGVLGENATVTSEDANATIGVNNGQKTIPCAITVSENNAINFYTRYNTDTITVSGVISGAGSVKKNGPGKLTLSGVNTFTGGLEVSNGQVNAGIAASDSGSAFGALQDGSWVTVRSGATLDLNGKASLDNNGYRIKSAGTIRSSADMDANSKCIGALELIGNTTVEGTYFGMSVGSNNTATTIKMGGYTLTIHMDSGKNFNLRNTAITGGGIIEQTQGSILVFNNKTTYDGTLKKNGGNIEIKGGLDLDVQNLEFGANPGTFSSTGCLVVRGKMSGSGTVACNLSLETNATIDASNGSVTANGLLWFHNSHKIIANVGDTVITKTGYTETMPSVTRVDAEGQTVAGDYYLNNNGGVISLGQYVARDTNGTLYKTIRAAIEGVGAENISTITVLVNDAEVPPGYRINNGTIEAYESIYSKWTDVPAMFTYSGSDGNFHKGHYIKFDLSKEAEATPKVDINGNGSVAANTLPEWNTALGLGWYLFCSSSGYNSYGPGYALRFAGTEGAGAKDASFNDLTFGGMIVEEGAVGWSITNNGGSRTTYLGDGRVGDNAIETWFVYNESFEFNRGPITLRGEINFDIADGKTLSLNTANGNGNAVTVDANTAANVKFHGDGQLAVKTLNAKGAVTLDYSDVDCATTAYISGTLAIDVNTIIKLPAGAQVGSSYMLATTAITGTIDDMNVLVGGEEMSDTIHWTISGGTITASAATPVASVNGLEFMSLTKAIAAASEGQNKTVTLLSDIDGGNRIVPSGVVIDTDGHTLSGSIALQNGAYILEKVGDTKKPMINGIATSIDVTYGSGTIGSCLKYSAFGGLSECNGNSPVYTADADAIMLNKNPWLKNVNTFFTSTEQITFATAGIMPKANKTIFAHMGSKNSWGLFLATGTNSTDVVIGYNEGLTPHEITTINVPNARTHRHTYIITKNDNMSSTPTKTTFVIYLDGIKWKTFEHTPRFEITGGFQVGSTFEGIINDFKAVGNTSGVTEDVAYVNFMRAYDRIISSEEIKAYTDAYPYTSPNGTYTRTMTEGGDWVADNAWTSDESTVNKPSSNGNVVLTANAEGSTTAVAINLNEDVEYEKLTLSGTAMSFARVDESAKSVKAVCTVIGAPVTLNHRAVVLTAGPTIIVEGGSLTFDFSSLTATEVAKNPAGVLTMAVTGEMDQQATGVVSLTRPTDPDIKSAEIGYNQNHYEVVVRNYAAKMVDGETVTHYDTLTDALAAAGRYPTKVTILDGTTELPEGGQNYAYCVGEGGVIQEAEASLGTTRGYASLGAALAVATSGDTVYLYKSVTFDEALDIPEGVTVEMTGEYTISGTLNFNDGAQLITYVEITEATTLNSAVAGKMVIGLYDSLDQIWVYELGSGTAFTFETGAGAGNNSSYMASNNPVFALCVPASEDAPAGSVIHVKSLVLGRSEPATPEKLPDYIRVGESTYSAIVNGTGEPSTAARFSDNSYKQTYTFEDLDIVVGTSYPLAFTSDTEGTIPNESRWYVHKSAVGPIMPVPADGYAIVAQLNGIIEKAPLALPTTEWGSNDNRATYLAIGDEPSTYVFAGMTLADIVSDKYELSTWMAGANDSNGNAWLRPPCAGTIFWTDSDASDKTVVFQSQCPNGNFSLVQKVELTEEEFGGNSYIKARDLGQFYVSGKTTYQSLIAGPGTALAVTSHFVECVRLTLTPYLIDGTTLSAESLLQPEGGLRIAPNATVTIDGAGAVITPNMELSAGSKLVIDPVRTPILVNSKVAFGSNAKLSLASDYASVTCGKMTLFTYPTACTITESAITEAIVDSTSFNNASYTVTIENSPKSGYKRVVLTIGDYASVPETTFLPLGDSITEGYTDGIGATGVPNYRVPLMEMLAAHGYKPVTRGYRTTNNQNAINMTTDEAYQNHCGMVGHRILTGFGGGDFGGYRGFAGGYLQGVENYLAQAGEVDYITLLIGTNDIERSPNGAGGDAARQQSCDFIFANWKTLIKRVVKQNPTSRVILTTLPANSGDKETLTQLLNAKIQAYIGSDESVTDGIPSEQVTLIDLHTACEGQFIPASSLHPNWNGHIKNAAAWFAGIKAAEAKSFVKDETKLQTKTGIENTIPSAYTKGYVKLAEVDVKNIAKLSSVAEHVTKIASKEGKTLTRVGYYVESQFAHQTQTAYLWVDMPVWSEGNATKTLADVSVPTTETGLVRDVVDGIHVYSAGAGVENVEPTDDTVKGIIVRTIKGLNRAAGSVLTEKGEPTPLSAVFDWNDSANASANWGAWQVFRINTAETGFTSASTLFTFGAYNTANPSDGNDFGIGDLAKHSESLSMSWIDTGSRYPVLSAGNRKVAKIEIWGKIEGAVIPEANEAVVVEAATKEAALEMTDIVIADEAAEAAGQTVDILKKVATDNGDGTWSIKVELDGEAVIPDTSKTVQAAVEETAVEFAKTGLEAVAGATEETQVSIPAAKVVPGLYYSVSFGTSPDNHTQESERVLATGSEGVTIPVPALGDEKVYYIKIKASATK